MASINKRTQTKFTHEGAPAYEHLTPLQILKRSLMSCMLWEDEFYEEGQSIASRIVQHAQAVGTAELIDVAIEARHQGHLRHAPLLILLELVRRGGSHVVGDTVARICTRPDQMTELLALYWKDGRRPLSAQLKKGLAQAFASFDAYQLAKYNRVGKVTLRDVMFLTHPNPRNPEVAKAWKQLAERDDSGAGGLKANTWESRAAGGMAKRENFQELLEQGKLGYMALLRNLRGMAEAGVDEQLIKNAIVARKGAKQVLPFRFLMAARMAPQFEQYLDVALLKVIKDLPELPGETLLLIDTSGSMEARVSQKSQVSRCDAAATLGAMVCGDIRCFAFATGVAEVPHRLGMAGVDAFQTRDLGYGTNIGLAVRTATQKYPNADRMIVVSDEQSHDPVSVPLTKRNYMINVASYENGVGYGPWTHIDGFSERTISWIHEYEGLTQ